MDGREIAGEMSSQAEAELFDLAHRRLFRKGKYRVLLRVRGHDVGVVAIDVAGLEVAGKRDGDGKVLDLVGAAISGDADQMRLRLPVLVVAEDDFHWPLYVE
jgi:hypothetical protein